MNYLYIFLIFLLFLLLLVKNINRISTKKYEFLNFTSKTYYQMWYEIADRIADVKSRVSVSRFGDGEYSIMIGKAVEGIDHFGYKGGGCKIREELMAALQCPTNGNCYFGVYYRHLLYFLKLSNQYLNFFTTSNIFCNKNYIKTKLLLESLINDERNEIILFCNYGANYTSFAKIVIYFPNNIIKYYENNNKNLIKKVTSLAKKYNNHLFILSIGPLSPVLIYHMRNANLNNRYIDFGSTTDEIIKGYTNRDYVNPNNKNGNRIEKRWILFVNKSLIFI